MSEALVRQWTRVFGDSPTLRGYGVSASRQDEIYVAGYTYSDLNDQVVTGTQDGYLVKYASDGEIVWTKLVGVSGEVTLAKGVSAASDGTIYIAGVTRGELDGQQNSGSGDAFVAKYASDGTRLWSRLFGSDGNEDVKRVSSASDGSVYIVGGTDSSSFYGRESGGNYDAYVAKYSSDGARLWTNSLGGEGLDYAFGVSTASDGSVYVVGQTDSIYFDGQLTARGRGEGYNDYDAFVTKYASDGSKEWTRLISGASSFQAFDVDVAKDGSIYIAGNAFVT